MANQGQSYQVELCSDWLRMCAYIPSFLHRAPGTAEISVTSATERCPPHCESCQELNRQNNRESAVENVEKCSKTKVD